MAIASCRHGRFMGVQPLACLLRAAAQAITISSTSITRE
jgi:hypothetical protein